MGSVFGIANPPSVAATPSCHSRLLRLRTTSAPIQEDTTITALVSDTICSFVYRDCSWCPLRICCGQLRQERKQPFTSACWAKAVARLRPVRAADLGLQLLSDPRRGTARRRVAVHNRPSRALPEEEPLDRQGVWLRWKKHRRNRFESLLGCMTYSWCSRTAILS